MQVASFESTLIRTPQNWNLRRATSKIICKGIFRDSYERSINSSNSSRWRNSRSRGNYYQSDRNSQSAASTLASLYRCFRAGDDCWIIAHIGDENQVCPRQSPHQGGWADGWANGRCWGRWDCQRLCK